ncbi:AcrR family transcriptional regulator [Geodermatophilus bullaregiensis]|uniref:TetR/AcrR family transcriptional regulator n=1 Tax=Geodermatophilus bullaregiensis TaxID=1564160 RepID=UPI00195C07CE|nr:TetR/AcrR family transcriptional regulator [Geodermatophilus bullaregiensis]MBM7804389.1 AcrR family transcriptional regulator [Geodermatophilus bullaregiensis]
MSVPAERRRPGPRRALTEDEILDAALSLLDDGGADAASVRGIAARVGVAPNAVYTYFPDKAAVVKALVERLLGEVDHDVFADRSRPWRERVEALALDLRAHLSAHPGAVGLMIGGPMDGPHALRLNERLLELLADAGLDRTGAARAAYLLIVYVFGSIALEVAAQHEPGPLPPESDRIDARTQAFAATPADRFPRSAAAAATMAGYISTEQYLWGLRRVLDGITAGVTDVPEDLDGGRGAVRTVGPFPEVGADGSGRSVDVLDDAAS